ncbi:zincin-like metallopeptidase domain-containing protein [Synechococcus sp. L2F]|uniref:zincin-like metallopeptidase domain-containing protein n=1 Tax=Synechococcus sp. L2F TaxID=2823739 RepID=UPI0020CC4E42|nr:zincin-like metallopeptidase domain-containing protein [Synechococcus sp. L2F]
MVLTALLALIRPERRFSRRRYCRPAWSAHGCGAAADRGDRACDLPAIDRIQLPDRASFYSPAAFCANWAHEQIHSTRHESPLKRDLGGVFVKPRYAREELVAELGALLLGDRMEIGSEIESYVADLGHWFELLRQSPEVLFQVLSEARQAADLICPEASEQLEHQGELRPA